MFLAQVVPSWKLAASAVVMTSALISGAVQAQAKACDFHQAVQGEMNPLMDRVMQLSLSGAKLIDEQKKSHWYKEDHVTPEGAAEIGSFNTRLKINQTEYSYRR